MHSGFGVEGEVCFVRTTGRVRELDWCLESDWGSHAG